MESLPDELLVNEILGRMSYQEILEKCTIEWRFARICSDDRFWLFLTRRDFPQEIRFNPGISWRQYYDHLVRDSVILPIYFYNDPIEWVRLTHFNLGGVIQLIQGLLQRLGIPDFKIVFTQSTFPISYFTDGQYRLVPRKHESPIDRVVLLPSDVEVNYFEVQKRLTTPDLQKGHESIHGSIEDGEFFLGLAPPQFEGDETMVECLDDSLDALKLVADELGLTGLSWDEVNRPEICHMIEEKLRSMGRILDEVAPPTKPLLE